MLKEDTKNDATIIANCIKELGQMEDAAARQRALKAIAIFFGVDWPQVISRPPSNWGGGSGTFRYGTPFP